MSGTPMVCVLGQALVDFTMGSPDRKPLLRIGGVVHAARALWALGCPYALAYVAPEYLATSVEHYVAHHGAKDARRVGNVLGCPNVITIAEPTEAGPQGYEFLLRDALKCIMYPDAVPEVLGAKDVTDVLLFPGGFDLSTVLRALEGSPAEVHIDVNFEPADPTRLEDLGRPFATVILSTSSDLFRSRYGGSAYRFRDAMLGHYADAVLLKENRGGSRFFRGTLGAEPVAVPAQVRHVLHSVGVGDCFDAAYVVLRHRMEDRAALAYAASIAAEYACTVSPDAFKTAVEGTLAVPQHEIIALKGVSLPWEDRPRCNVYLAAPDFDYVQRRPLECLADCLKYHNFTPRRPVLEHGQAPIHASPQKKQALCDADVRLMDECQMMIAVLLMDDPGTFIEIGMAVERGMPVIVYDPYEQAGNLMLTQLPHLVSHDIDEVISAVFRLAPQVI